MVQSKRFLLRLFFVIEIFLFLVIYFFGTQGLHVVLAMRRDNVVFAAEIFQLEGELKELQKTIALWKKNSFYKEKAAREQLHMAHPDDEIYFIN